MAKHLKEEKFEQEFRWKGLGGGGRVSTESARGEANSEVLKVPL